MFPFVRYSVEVADFDFGVSDEPEYKTLYEQLKEALSQAVRGYDPDAEEEDKWRGTRQVVEQPRVRRKHYGTMLR